MNSIRPVRETHLFGVKSGCLVRMEGQNEEENMSFQIYSADMGRGLSHPCLCPHTRSSAPFMHLYLWGAESRDFGSIIAGWVAADRKSRPICWSSLLPLLTMEDVSASERCFCYLTVITACFSIQFSSVQFNVCFIGVIKWTICIYTHRGWTQNHDHLYILMQ